MGRLEVQGSGPEGHADRRPTRTDTSPGARAPRSGCAYPISSIADCNISPPAGRSEVVATLSNPARCASRRVRARSDPHRGR
jgi:hypothetical protein